MELKLNGEESDGEVNGRERICIKLAHLGSRSKVGHDEHISQEKMLIIILSLACYFNNWHCVMTAFLLIKWNHRPKTANNKNSSVMEIPSNYPDYGRIYISVVEDALDWTKQVDCSIIKSLLKRTDTCMQMMIYCLHPMVADTFMCDFCPLSLLRYFNVYILTIAFLSAQLLGRDFQDNFVLARGRETIHKWYNWFLTDNTSSQSKVNFYLSYLISRDISIFPWKICPKNIENLQVCSCRW